MLVEVDLLDDGVVQAQEQKHEEEVDLLSHYFPNFHSTLENKFVDGKNENKKEKWQPKKWTVEYEKIVMYDLIGLKGYEIAEKLSCTPQHVYNILGTDEAIAIQKAMVGKIRTNGIDITKELKEIQELTVSRLKKCLQDDNIFKESRLGFIAKGIDVMKGTGEHLKNAPSNQQVNNFMIPPSVAERFMAGLEKADEVRQMFSNNKPKLLESVKIEEAEIVE